MKDYYAQDKLWSRKLTVQEKTRIDIVKNYIPNNVKTILDAGCGNGAISNYLEDFDITSIDKSINALTHVKNKPIYGSLDNLPFKDNSFDLIICSDVLEHLSNNIYKKTIIELKRVSKKYILIISPNNEDLEANQTKCIKCGTVFHINWHIRSISLDYIVNNFRDDFVPVIYSFFGDRWTSEPKIKYLLSRLVKKGYKYWENAVCPLCNTKQKNKLEDTKNLDIQTNKFLNGFYNHSTEFIVLLSTIKHKKKIFDFDKINNQSMFLSRQEVDDLIYINRQSIITNNSIFIKPHTEVYPQHAYLIDQNEKNKGFNRKCFCMPYLANSKSVYFEYLDKIKTESQINLYDLVRGYINIGTLQFTGDGELKQHSFALPEDIIPANEGLIFEIILDKNIAFEDLNITKIYIDNSCKQIEFTKLNNVELLSKKYFLYEYSLTEDTEGKFLLLPSNSLIYDQKNKCFYYNLDDTFEFFNKVFKVTKQEINTIKNELIKPKIQLEAKINQITEEVSILKNELYTTKQDIYTVSNTVEKNYQCLCYNFNKAFKVTDQEITGIKNGLIKQNVQLKTTTNQVKETISNLQAELYATKQGIYTVSNTVENLIYKLKNPFRTLFKLDKKNTTKHSRANQKKLLVITPDTRIDRRTIQICQTFIKAFNIKCTIIAALKGKDDLLIEGLNVKRVDPSRTKKYILKPNEWRDNTGINLEDCYWLHYHYLYMAMNEEAEYIMCCDLPLLPTATYVSKIKNIPLIYDAHELYPEQICFDREKRDLYSKIEANFIVHPDLVITVNKSIAKEMSKRYSIKTPTVILNALDPPKFFNINKKYDHFRKNLPIDNNQKIVLYQGGYSPHRNLDLFVRCARYLSDNITLILMGFGDYKRELEKIAREYNTINKKVFFAPAVNQSVLLEFSASADVGIIPYPHIDLNSYYCTPNKLFEFIQAGTPIIANDSPELNRFIRDNEIGITRKIETERDIAELIETFFNQNIDYKSNILGIRKRINWRNEEKKLLQATQKIFCVNQ